MIASRGASDKSPPGVSNYFAIKFMRVRRWFMRFLLWRSPNVKYAEERRTESDISSQGWDICNRSKVEGAL